MKTSPTLIVGLTLVSALLTVIWGEPFLRLLRHWRIGKRIRAEGPARHQVKMGTLTMGGWLIVLPTAILTLFLYATQVAGLTFLGKEILLPLGVMLSHALLGAVDDWMGVRYGQGMRARTKFAFQVLLAALATWSLQTIYVAPPMYLPGVTLPIPLGWVYVPLSIFIIVATSNAVNITDGLDGLAALTTATAFAAYGGIALATGEALLARFCFILVGSILGFLWFNAHPAQLFMGDTGSLALGATLGVVALMTGEWLVLPLIALIPVVEVLSVMVQVAYFKATKGRRIFRMAPLHHHFELGGWSEMQVVLRFWIVNLLAALLGVLIAMA
ncbi:MAG: phospho-N-acetylmuramoyl-pentapeptide-transferase [Chloroflexi bacterium]|nr:phospho-N-acetylmuramoyl-pentapeptide-transferase [Chloroflexota bacterium]